MALTRQKKEKLVDKTAKMLAESKMTVVARYQGTSVATLQDLRRQARDSQTTVRIIKNRLVKRALSEVEPLKPTDTAFLTGQLMYAFNAHDEVAPAQVIARFAKEEPQLQFVAGIMADGTVLSADDVGQLAALPTKEQLRGQLIGLIASPLSGFVGVLGGNARSILNVLSAREKQLQS